MIEDFFVKISKKIIHQFNRLGYLGSELFPSSRFGYQHPGFVVSITTRCNFCCPHCLRAAIDKNKTFIKDLPLPIFETILKEGKKLNFQYISITGGEPILHPQFKEIIFLINQYGYKFYLGSNGWFYKEYWEAIKQNQKNFKFIFLSLDGLTPEVHDAVRNQPGSFEKVIEAIKFYKEQKMTSVITFCVTPKNYHQIEKLPDFCLKRGIKFIKWVTVIPRERELGIDFLSYVLTDNQRREALRKILRLKEEFKGRCVFSITASFFSASGIVRDEIYLNKGIDFCSALNGHNFYIDHDGGMFFCCDINRECKNKPLIQKVGFEKSLRITLDIANEMKKKFLSDLLNNPQKINRICDFCNDNIDFCSQLITKRLP